MKTKLVIVSVSVVAAAVLSVAAIWYFAQGGKKGSEVTNEYPTDRAGYAEEEIPHADPLIVGKWRNADKPQWCKVYYDDQDDDSQLFWGKEWDESEDVFEWDLAYHGNGWFRWEKKGRMLYEYAVMEIKDVSVPCIYRLRLSDSDSLVFYEQGDKAVVYRFFKAE